jgi:hypothetical protein
MCTAKWVSCSWLPIILYSVQQKIVSKLLELAELGLNAIDWLRMKSFSRFQERKQWGKFQRLKTAPIDPE